MAVEIDKNVYNCRPEDKRSDAEEKIYDVLEKLGVEYNRVDHEHADTIEDCVAVEDVLGVKICKNLVLCNSQKTSFYLLMMPGDKKFITKVLSKEINSARLSFATPEYLNKYLSVEPGSVSVLELIFDTENDVRLLIDGDLLKDEYIGCHPGKNTSTLKIKISDITEKFLPYAKHTFETVTL